MAELSIKALFCKVCGEEGKIDRSDVENGRLSKDIARELGIIDENGNYTDKTYTQEEFEDGFDINKLLNRARTEGKKVKTDKTNKESNGKRVNENGSKAISQEEYVLKGRKGVLIKFEDGSLEFDGSNKNSVFKYKYKNQADFDSKKPVKSVEGPRLGDNEFTRTTSYEYYPNGKLKHEQQVLDRTGAVLKTGDYDDRGGLISQKKYNKDGNLLESSEGKWEDENTHITVVRDKDNKKTTKIVDKIKEGQLETRNIYNKDDVLIQENKYTKNKLSEKRVYYPDNGKLRTVAEFFPNGGYKSIKTFDKDGKELQNYTADMVPDGKTWDKSAAQVGEGDCYLVASVNAIRKLSDGDKMLSNLIDIKTDSNGKKTYTVTLPGAIIAAKGLAKDKNIDPNKMFITGTYTFTEEEFDRIAHMQGSKYSIGNANIVLLEAAFEKFREEVSKTVEANNINPNKNVDIPGLFTTGQGLAGGVAYDAVFMLTGKPSKVYQNNNPDYSLDRNALQNGKVKLVNNNDDALMHKAAPSSVEEMTKEKSRLNVMLDEIMNDIKDGKKDVIATVGFRIYNSETGKLTGHALTIVDVTDTTVTITNPWYPDRTLTMSREDFLASADMVTICDASKNPKIKEKEIVKPNSNTKPEGNKPENNKPHKKEERTLSSEEERKVEKQIKDLVKNWGKRPKANISSNDRKMIEKWLNIEKNGNKTKKKNTEETTLSKTEEEKTIKQLADLVKRMSRKK